MSEIDVKKIKLPEDSLGAGALAAGFSCFSCFPRDLLLLFLLLEGAASESCRVSLSPASWDSKSASYKTIVATLAIVQIDSENEIVKEKNTYFFTVILLLLLFLFIFFAFTLSLSLLSLLPFAVAFLRLVLIITLKKQTRYN